MFRRASILIKSHTHLGCCRNAKIGVRSSILPSIRTISYCDVSQSAPSGTPPSSNIGEIIELLNTIKETAYAISLAAPVFNAVLVLGVGGYGAYRVWRYKSKLQQGVEDVKKSVEQSADAVISTVKVNLNEVQNAVQKAEVEVSKAQSLVHATIDSNTKKILEAGQQQLDSVQAVVKDKVSSTYNVLDSSARTVSNEVNAVNKAVRSQIDQVNNVISTTTDAIQEMNKSSKKNIEDLSSKLSAQLKEANTSVQSISASINDTIKKVDISEAHKAASNVVESFWRPKSKP